MSGKRHFLRDTLLGLISFVILYYVMTGDPTRFSRHLCEYLPSNIFTSSAVFALCMVALFFFEGARAAECDDAPEAGPGRRVLGYYTTYWKICLPLILIGFLVFYKSQSTSIYCPVFATPVFGNVGLTVLALSNRIHEGAWVIVCLCMGALCTSQYSRACQSGGKRPALLLLPAGGVVAVALIYRFLIPFVYHTSIYPIAAIAGTAGYMAGYLLYRRPALQKLLRLDQLDAIGENKVLRFITAPVRYVGRHWVAFWLLQFFTAYYLYELPASIYSMTHSLNRGYPLILALTVLLLFGMDWGYRQFEKAYKQSRGTAIAVVLMLAVPFLLHFALEASVDYGVYVRDAAKQWPKYTTTSAMAIMCLIMIFRALTGRWLISGAITSVLLTVLGIANYFTMKYHGTLLTVEDLANIQTAANVAGGYDLSLDGTSLRVLLLGLGGLACCVVSWLIIRKKKPVFTKASRWISRAVCLVMAFVLTMFIYFTPKSLVWYDDNIWNWLILYSHVGYFSGTVQSTRSNFSFVMRKPDYYSDDRIQELAEQAEQSEAAPESGAAASDQTYPDIIMILDETWYDLNKYVDVNADVDFMAHYNALDNAVKGYVETPLTGGGTNSSEYEMLTANSTSLINAYSPYNRLDFTDQIALPGYLKQFGYSTIATHPLYSQNYQRGYRWDQLQFDETYFLADYTDLEYYGDRKGDFDRCTDLSAMKNLVRFYNDMPEDRPRFAFMITIQSHGGWRSNPPELALVHCGIDPQNEDLTRVVNEYLSCVSLTDEMIGYVQEYFEDLYRTTGRKVIVCMAGDHGPSLISSLAPYCKWEDPVYSIRMSRATPYFIWANYPLDFDALDLTGTEEMDLNCIMPTTLDVAGIPLSYYYRHVLNMRREISVFTNVGSSSFLSESNDSYFSDRDNNLHNVLEDSPLAQQVRDYYIMEYNLGAKGKDRDERLFWPSGHAPEDG